MTKKRPPAKDAWARPQLTIRLTSRRRQLLRRLAEREAIGGTPGDAVDRAIELALFDIEDDDPERLAALEERFDRAEARREAQAEAAVVALAEVAQELARLRALIAALDDAL